MKVIAWTVLLIACLAVGMCYGQVPGVEKRRVQADCGAESCLVARADLEGLAAANQLLAELVERLQAQLRALRDIKGCGKLDVLPPPKPVKPASGPQDRTT